MFNIITKTSYFFWLCFCIYFNSLFLEFFYDCFSKLMFIGNIIIIIMSRRLRGYPWPSLAISPYHSSPPAGLQGYIPCPHIAAVCKFVLVVPLLHIHVWGSTGVHRLQVFFVISLLFLLFLVLLIFYAFLFALCKNRLE